MTPISVANLAENPLDLADFAFIWRTADFLADFYASVGGFFSKLRNFKKDFIMKY